MNDAPHRIALFNMHSDPLVAIGTQEAGGQNVYVRSLMNELDRRGWAVDAFTRLNDPRRKAIVSVGKHSRVIRLKAGPVAHVTKSELHEHMPEFYKNFLAFIDNKNPYEIVHGHYWDGGWAGLQAQQQFHIPFIETYHSLGKVKLTIKQQHGQEKIDSHFDARFFVEEEIGKKSSLVITLSETEKRDLHLLYGIPEEKIVVIPGAVNFRVFHPASREYARASLGLSPRDYIIVYVGRLEWRKGLGTLISAIKMLAKDIPNVKAVIVGGGIKGKQKNPEDFAEYQRLVERAKAEGVEDRIQFVGRVAHSQVHMYYSAANAQAIPSYYEPFGLVALEGMACQIPVVASRKGGLRLTINDRKTGLLFEPRNAQDLHDKILELYQQPELVGACVKAAYDMVRKDYAWKDIVQQIEQLYLKLIDENKKSLPPAV
jgi:D-inositol-3-phosphate glycosyltransferase